MIVPETIEMATSDRKMYSLTKLINTEEYHPFDMIVFNDTSIPFPHYSSLRSLVSKPIRREKCPFFVTWKQIKRQRREYGNIS